MRRMLGFVSVALVTLCLLACSRDGGQVPALQGGAAAIDARTPTTGFELVSAGRGRTEGEPALELVFSQPLAAAQDFDAQVAVLDGKGATVSGSWVLGDTSDRLYFPYIDADAEYTVKLTAALAAADGSTLQSPQERKIFTGPLEPAVGFASQGSVLPARDSRGLPVVSVNVAEVDVEFLRVRDSEVANFFVSYQRGGRRGGWELGENEWSGRTAITRVADPVYLNRFVLGGAENERRLSYLPLKNIAELQQPGLYFALMRKVGDYDGAYDTAIFFVSDLGLHLRAYRDSVLVHVASLKDGSDVGDVALALVDRQGRDVATASTDGNGNALIAYSLNAEHVLVARRGTDVSLLPLNQPALDLSEFAVAGRGQADFDVFAWSGRDLYRPGETLQLSALLRDHDGRAGAQPQPLYVALKQPDGRLLIESQLAPGDGGYYRWEHALPADAPTGRWQVEFRTTPGASQVVHGMSLRIEEFLPERMKLELAAPDTLDVTPRVPLEVTAAYLYGAPAAGNRFTARLSLGLDAHPVASLPDHFFGDATVSLPKSDGDVIDQALDAQGRLQAKIALPEEVGKARTPVSVVVSGSVYESGGRPVTRALKRTVWPATELVGVRPLFDVKDGAPANGNAGFELVRSRADGTLVAAPDLKVSLVRELRDYHWLFRDNRWDFDYSARFQTVETRSVAARAEGGVRIDFPVEWGEYRLEVQDPLTGLVTRFPFVAGWSWDNQNRGLDARPDKVKLALDRTHYGAGDRLKLTVTPPQAGRGVLIVESDRLLHIQSIEATPGAEFTLDVTEDWERHDVYITAVVLRGGSAVEKITPARALGVTHVPMDRQSRRVEVTLDAPAQALPEQPLPITVQATELAGTPAWVTVSAVDLGIINITRFPVPDANAHFFAQRRLGIDAYDLYGRVIESFDGEMARLRFGGDMALGPLPQARRPTARVQTVDLFSGPVLLDAKGKATVQVPVPDFNGTLRVSALVFSADRYGQASAESVLRAPILAELSAPRVLAPGDESTVTLDVQNFTGKDGAFEVNLAATGPLAVAQPKRSVSLADQAKTTLTFPIAGKEGAGVAVLDLRVAGAGKVVNRRIELAVRPAWAAQTRSQARTLASGQAWQLGPELASGLMPDTVTARLTVSSVPPIPFQRALQDLLAYPYGCLEQTTTRGFAALLLDQDSAQRMGIDGLAPEDRQRRLEGAFGRLAAMQTGTGHFSFWGGDSGSMPVLTPYVVEFLLLARDGGFAMPDTLLQKSLERLSEDLLTGGLPFYAYAHPDHMRFAYQAHAGYVLSRVNRAPLGTLRALYDNQRGKSMTGLPLLHLGLALVQQGDTARGEKAIAEALAKQDARPRWLGDYGSSLRDQTLMLALLKEHARTPDAFAPALLAVSRELQARSGERYWLSTQEQIALGRLGKALAVDSAQRFSATLTMAGKEESLARQRLLSREFDQAALSAGVRAAATSESPLYASVDVAGVSRTAPKADSSAISVKRRWYRTDGKPWTGTRLREGEVLVAAVQIEAREAMPDALLVDLLPAGLEVENLNLVDAAQWAEVEIEGVNLGERASEADLRHEEYRDDRYVAALKLDAGTTARVFYLVRAVTPGTYAVPPPQVEDMYRPALRGVGEALPATVTVVEP